MNKDQDNNHNHKVTNSGTINDSNIINVNYHQPLTNQRIFPTITTKEVEKENKIIKDKQVSSMIVDEDAPIDLGEEDLFNLFETDSQNTEDIIMNLAEELAKEMKNQENLDPNNRTKQRAKMYPEEISSYYEVVEVIQVNSKQKELRCQEKILESGFEEMCLITTKLIMKGLWAEVMVDPGDTCYISARLVDSNSYEIADENMSNSYLRPGNNFQAQSKVLNKDSRNVDMVKYFIIVEPEMLISPSRIKMAFPCQRKSILADNIKPIFNLLFTKENLVGEIVHEVFQTVIRDSDKADKTNVRMTENSIGKIIDRILLKKQLDFAIHNINPEDMEQIVKGYISKIMKFFDFFFVKKYALEGIKINKYIGSERLFQSQVLGMKGVIDMLVETENDKKNIEVTPLELKTGNSQNNSDIMQVLVYCLILSEQLERDSYNGIVSYIKRESNLRIKIRKNDIVNVMVVRNNLAKLTKNVSNFPSTYKDGLPPLYSYKSECSRCWHKDMCHFHYANYEKSEVLNNTNFTEDELKEELCLQKFLKDQPTQIYFNLYYSIVNEEESFAYRNEKSKIKDGEIADLSDFKEYHILDKKDKGNSYNITICPVENIDEEDKKEDFEDEIISQFMYINDGYHIYEKNNRKSFPGVLIQKNDQNSQFTLNILKNYLYKYKTEQSFWSDSRVKSLYLKNITAFSKFSYRIMRGNLVLLCNGEKPRLKELLVNNAVTFINTSERSHMEKFIDLHYKKEFQSLNRNQKDGIMNALLCEDYSIIIGYPGSGKSTLITLLTDILVRLGKRVLITAHTNAAVDNILLKLKEKNVNFVRISDNEERVHPAVRDRIFKKQPCETFRDWRKFIETTKVYGMTSLGVLSKCVINTKFDYCIVDEACQIFEANLIGPLLFSQKFVLVGDPLQLPALLRSMQDMPGSLLERLYSHNPGTGVELSLQYRMNQDILELSNSCVYNYGLQCANDSVANRRLKINYENTKYIFDSFFPSWLSIAMNPDNPVVFIDYSIYAETYEPDYLFQVVDHNLIEMRIIDTLMNGFSVAGLDLQDLGIITPYVKQETILQNEFRSKYNFFNVLTIDKSQGQEKEVIILSFVKTNERTKLLEDIARMNVAFTRAKSKLIVIGISEVLEKIRNIEKYIKIIKERNWIVYAEKLDN